VMEGVEVFLPKELYLLICQYFNAYELACIISRISKKWKRAAEADTLWKEQCYKTWKKWNQNPELLGKNMSWKQVYKKRLLQDFETRKLLYMMCWPKISEEAEDKIVSYGDEILEYLKLLTERKKDLTISYFANEMLQRMKLLYVLEGWKSFFKRSKENQIVEDGAALFMHWNNYTDIFPEVTQEKLRKKLDDIAQHIKLSSYPNCSDEELLICLNREFVLMGFKGNSLNYYDDKNSFLDEVMKSKQGIPISLSVVYSAIARRLGLRIDLIGAPGHVITRFRSKAGREFYIDVFNNAKILSREECIVRFAIINEQLLAPMENAKIFTRMCNNLLHVYRKTAKVYKYIDVVDQILIMDNQNEERMTKVSLTLENVRRPRVKELLKEIQILKSFGNMIPQAWESKIDEIPKPIITKIRSLFNPLPKFRVGDNVLMNRAHHGVVVGWVFENKCFQYYLCLENFTIVCYAEKELVLESSHELSTNLGWYFKEFNGRYIPNEALHAEYPED